MWGFHLNSLATSHGATSCIRIDDMPIRISAFVNSAMAIDGIKHIPQGVSLRGIAGSGASRALVTLDGVPQNDPFGGWVIWTGLPTEAVSAATLVRGAGAGPYGAGALTGVVALQQPARIEGGFAGEVEGGSLGYARAAGIGEADLGRSRLFLDASGETSDGWIPVIQGRGAADRPLTLHDWSAAERVETDLGGLLLSERVSAFDERRGSGVAVRQCRGARRAGQSDAGAAAGRRAPRLEAAGLGLRLQPDQQHRVGLCRSQHRDLGQQPVRHAGDRGRLQRRGAPHRRGVEAGPIAGVAYWLLAKVAVLRLARPTRCC